ncbi:MAG: flagellar hook protein FlgE [Alphaproteobacteria bacterium RIFCSPHIGHO2_12_FULL_45_9]|nr:MAG: flagellar hook protein FlgE [Alphaproteobacteria bacterium RIFCSPHIGHO2_02_FULL_46_13]OFW96302.1 MAG: flagellar hook protein FlgE [Alphaproteobacteria bacterium RIFCSPHIGHO2_12_FULL_45_9]
MSLNGALNAAVSGLRAQSTAVAAVSENIANASTTAYKIRQVSFQSLVTGAGSRAGGAVVYETSQDIRAQGQIQATDTSTNISINGNGFFVVSDQVDNQPSAYTYTRNGSFSTDAQGYLINSEGYYLLGQATDDLGNVISTSANDLNSLVPVDVNSISGTAQATAEVRFDMNLPADAAIADTFNNSIEIFDALGVSHQISITWAKTAANSWTATFSDPVQTGTAIASGVLDTDPLTAGAQKTIAVTFNGNGSIASFTPAIPSFDITGFTTGANNSSVALDWGTVGGTDGLTQFSSNTTSPGLEIYLIDQDGVRFGQLSEITIDETGLVTAAFENGVRLPVYQIPIATFPNPNGLKHVEGTVYDENEAAGNYNLRLPGQGNAGNVVASALEQSTTDTSEEFNKMIVAQQAYSSAAQVVSTVSEMFTDLIGAVR